MGINGLINVTIPFAYIQFVRTNILSIIFDMPEVRNRFDLLSLSSFVGNVSVFVLRV